jgi:hypothetical protein
MRLRDIVSIALWLVLLASMSPIMWAAPAFAQMDCSECSITSECEAICTGSSGRNETCQDHTCKPPPPCNNEVCQTRADCPKSCVVNERQDSCRRFIPDICNVGQCKEVCSDTVDCQTPCIDSDNSAVEDCGDFGICVPSLSRKCSDVCKPFTGCSKTCELPSGDESTCKIEQRNNCNPENNILLFEAQNTFISSTGEFKPDKNRQPIIFEDGDIAVISRTSALREVGRDFIVIDNFMTINGVNVCKGAAGQQFPDSCFGAEKLNSQDPGVKGKPIEDVLTPIPPIDVSGFIPKGKQVLEVELVDSGVIGGNTDLYLLTTARLPEIVSRRFALVEPPKGSCENDPCRRGDTFKITANFIYTDPPVPVTSIICKDFFVNVKKLSRGNVLRNADNGPAGEGAILTPILPTAICADLLLRPRESFPIIFEIELKTTDPFQFEIDLIGFRILR